MTTLVRGRWVIPGADDAVIDDGAVLVEGGAIVALGAFDDLGRAHPQAQVLGSERHAVMPGLINAHHHSAAASHVQHGAPDMLLESWLKALWRMRATPTRLDILLSATRLPASRAMAPLTTMLLERLETAGKGDDGRRRLLADTLRLLATDGSRRGQSGPGLPD